MQRHALTDAQWRRLQRIGLGTTSCSSTRAASRSSATLRFRAIVTRYEKTARDYFALVQGVCARLWLEN